MPAAAHHHSDVERRLDVVERKTDNGLFVRTAEHREVIRRIDGDVGALARLIEVMQEERKAMMRMVAGAILMSTLNVIAGVVLFLVTRG